MKYSPVPAPSKNLLTGRQPFLLSLILRVVVTTACIGFAAPVSAASPTTHLLAIGVCPPWKPGPVEMCSNSVDAVSLALQHRLDIPDENVTKVVNAQATSQGLVTALEGLDHLGPSDRLVIFANLHAGTITPGTLATAANDVFVLWTEEKPAVGAFAVAMGDWMMAADFAALVHAIPAGEVILILDACESDAVSPLFIDEHPEDREHRPEVVITSAAADQFANITADGSIALFSQELAQAIASGSGTFREAVDTAAESTRVAAIPLCDATAAQAIKAGLDPLSCRQQPMVHDPHQLLSGIPLGS